MKNIFWAGRVFTCLEDLRIQGSRWCDTVCNVRIHSGFDERPIDRFNLERPHLLALPDEPHQAEEILFGKAIRWGIVRVDANDYSVPLIWLEGICGPSWMPPRCASTTRATSWPSMPAASETIRSSLIPNIRSAPGPCASSPNSPNLSFSSLTLNFPGTQLCR